MFLKPSSKKGLSRGPLISSPKGVYRDRRTQGPGSGGSSWGGVDQGELKGTSTGHRLGVRTLSLGGQGNEGCPGWSCGQESIAAQVGGIPGVNNFKGAWETAGAH